MPVYTQIRIRLCTHMHRHMRIFSVVNPVSHNDLTKIVNTITYCERAKPQKSLPTSLQKDKIDIEGEEKLKQDREGNVREKRCFLWIKRSPSGHSGQLGLRIRYSTHAYTHKHTWAWQPSLPLSFLLTPALSRDPTPRLLLYNSMTSALASAAGQLEELVLAARPCIFKTTLQIQSHHVSTALFYTANAVWTWMKTHAHKGRPIHIYNALEAYAIKRNSFKWTEGHFLRYNFFKNVH